MRCKCMPKMFPFSISFPYCKFSPNLNNDSSYITQKNKNKKPLSKSSQPKKEGREEVIDPPTYVPLLCFEEPKYSLKVKGLGFGAKVS